MVALRTCILLAVSIAVSTGQRFLQAADIPKTGYYLRQDDLRQDAIDALEGVVDNTASDDSEAENTDSDNSEADQEDNEEEDAYKDDGQSIAGVLKNSAIFKDFHDAYQTSEAQDTDTSNDDLSMADVFAASLQDDDESSNAYETTNEAEESNSPAAEYHDEASEEADAPEVSNDDDDASESGDEAEESLLQLDPAWFDTESDAEASSEADEHDEFGTDASERTRMSDESAALLQAGAKTEDNEDEAIGDDEEESNAYAYSAEDLNDDPDIGGLSWTEDNFEEDTAEAGESEEADDIADQEDEDEHGMDYSSDLDEEEQVGLG